MTVWVADCVKFKDVTPHREVGFFKIKPTCVEVGKSALSASIKLYKKGASQRKQYDFIGKKVKFASVGYLWR